MSKDTFSSFNPLINFIFFLGAVLFSMMFQHPVFVACSLCCSLIYYFTIKGRSGLPFFGFMVVLFLALTFINPVFNTGGTHLLFLFFGRRYTLESLIYGAALGGMIVSVLSWFGCYNAVMTSDKFIYLFGKLIPSISLVLSMILRLIPSLKKKANQFSSARASIGMAGDVSGSKIDKVFNGTVILGALTGWALEDGIVTADSMKARGYGSGKRTNYSIYRFDKRNVIVLVLMIVLIAAVIVCAANGATKAAFVPDLNMTWFGNPYLRYGHIIFAVFLLIPTFINAKEFITWQIIRSRI